MTAATEHILYHLNPRDLPGWPPVVDVYFDDGNGPAAVEIRFSTVNPGLPPKVFQHAQSMLYRITARRRTATIFQLMREGR